MSSLSPLRIFDLSLPGADAGKTLFSGFARRAINAYVPVMKHESAADPRYAGAGEVEIGGLKTFDHIARDAQTVEPDGRVAGIAALGVLKGDVDDLGRIFATALADRPTFANWAALSRRVGAFFSAVTPHLCAARQEFSDIYTVFAGGDDFYFLGPWRALKDFSAELRKEFRRYCAENHSLHFSASYLMVKPGHPMQAITEHVEAGLERAKGRRQDGRIVKDAIHLGSDDSGTTLSWDRFAEMEPRRRALGELVERHKLATAYLYDVLNYCSMSEKAKTQVTEARWRALLFYRTRRHIEQVAAMIVGVQAVAKGIPRTRRPRTGIARRFQGEWASWPVADWLTHADRAVLSANLHWVDWTRRSSRQRQQMTLGGWMGTITITGASPVIFAALNIGAQLGLGKETVFGMGHYRLLVMR